ncbi:MAG TPA: PAS domain-containing sensor histidine kinase, partial [Gemmatimonadaceae bacterium]|nr:PAS domain-containing sensor histidine kinase [Gemmatimonadaceae bacterium]
MANPNPKPVSATVPVDSREAAVVGGKASEEGVISPVRWQPAEAPALYRLLVESVVDYAIFALDTTGHIRTWNQGAQHIKGYTAEEIIGKHFSIFYPLEDRLARKPERELEIAIANGRVEDEDWRVRKDGTRFWANVVITALRDRSGNLVGFGKVTRDLTERRAAEEAIRESEQRFRLLVQNVQDYGVFMLDPGGHVASWNEGAERINGYTTDEIVGRHFSIFYPAEDLARNKPNFELEVAARDGRFEDEGWRVRKDGSRFWANVIITAIRDEHGKLIGFAKVTRDLTERRLAQDRAIADARRVAEAEAANRAKSEFLASMSHELRTPLNAIGGYTDLLLLGVAGSLDSAQREYLDRIRRSQQHLLGIINDLLNFSRLEAGRVTFDMQPMSLGDAVRRVLPMIEPQANQRGLRIALQPGRDEFAKADPAKVEQILLNLLSNAIKFTEPGGAVTIEQFAEGDVSGVRVRDTGIGIPSTKLEAIFEPFVQVGRTLNSL